MRCFLFLLLPLVAYSQEESTIFIPPGPPTVGIQAAEPLDYVCPMDTDIRSDKPGICPRCGMKLVRGIPERIEYPVELTLSPQRLKVNTDVQFTFRVRDPKAFTVVKDFEVVHEKFFHLFVISQDLSFFTHEHPEPQPDGSFTFRMRFPKPGMYRVLTDFYPRYGTPQLVEKTLMVPGPGFKLSVASLKKDLSPRHSENLEAELITEPPHPIAGQKTMMFLRLRPNDGIEPYLGATGHMLAASSDLIDMIHTHPFQVSDPPNEDYKELQFNLFFPREGVYRVWIQLQRKGVVNTVAFDVPVEGIH
jgi:Heavy metal binding domain